MSGDVLNYNVRDFGYDWAAIEDPYVDMLTISAKKSQLYKAIHIDGSKKSPIFNSGSEGVSEGYKSDNLVDYSSYYNYLLDQNYPFVVMAGEFDMQDGIASQYRWMKDLLKVSSEFWTQDRKVYYYQGNDNQTKVGGYYLTEKSFALLSVPKSGHFVPADNYYASKAYIDDIVVNGTLTC